MKNLKGTVLFLFLLTGIFAYSQEYKPGYIIKENSQKIRGLLKPSEFRKTPENFTFKLTASSKPKHFNVSDITEIHITDGVEFRWIKVSDMPANLAADGKRIFAQLIVSGNASLYKYKYHLEDVFFFQTKNDSISYLPLPNENAPDIFVSRLKNALVCENMHPTDFDNLKYTQNKLMTLFIRYNVCQKTSYINIESKVERDYFNLYLKGGLSLYNLQNNYGDGNNDYSLNFGSQFNIAAMPEVELFLTHFKHKLAFVTGLNYLSFKSEASKGIVKSNMDYKSFELPIGFRQYFHLTDQSSVFLNAFFVSNKGFDSSISFRDLYGQRTSFNLNNLIFNYAIGAGYNYNNRWSIELRYQLPFELYPREIYWSTKFAGLNLTLAYNLFK